MFSPRQHSLSFEASQASACTSQAICLPTCEKCGKTLTTDSTHSAFCCSCGPECLQGEIGEQNASKVDRWDERDWDDALPTPHHLKQEKYTNAFVDAVEGMLDERLRAVQHRENNALSFEDFARIKEALGDTNARLDQLEEQCNKIFGRVDQAIPEIEQKQQQLMRRVDIFETHQQQLTRRVAEFDVAPFEPMVGVVDEHGVRMDKLCKDIQKLEDRLLEFMNGPRHLKQEQYTNGGVDVLKQIVDERLDIFTQSLQDFDRRKKCLADGVGATLLIDRLLLALEHQEKSTVSHADFMRMQEALGDTEARLVQHQQRTDNVIECFLHQALPELKQKQQELFRHVDSCLHIIGVVGEHGVRVDKLFQEVQNLKDTLMPQVLALDAIQAHNIVSQVNSVHAQQAHWRKCSRRICELLQEATNLDGN